MNEISLIDAFVSALNALPHMTARARQLEAESSEWRVIDAIVEATIGGQPMTLMVEAKQTVFPRDVREAVWRLRKYQSHLLDLQGAPIAVFVIAEALSPGARESLRQEGVGYFDLGGSLFVDVPGAFVYIDKPPLKAKARALDSVFKGRRAQVLHAVFQRRGEWVSVKEIADASMASPATTSQTMVELERRDWMRSRGAGPAKVRRLEDPKALVDAWTSYLGSQKSHRPRRYYVPSASDLPRLLSDASRDMGATLAITGEAAAQRMAPYLTSSSQTLCRLLLDAGARNLLSALNAQPVSEGWNLGVIDTKVVADLNLGEPMDGVCLATPLQVYLDLQGGSGRAKELAEHFRRERLGV